jgi:hypothetical protein
MRTHALPSTASKSCRDNRGYLAEGFLGCKVAIAVGGEKFLARVDCAADQIGFTCSDQGLKRAHFRQISTLGTTQSRTKSEHRLLFY